MPISVHFNNFLTTSAGNGFYLKLDASNDPVTDDLRVNGKVLINDDNSYFEKSGDAINLYVNGVLAQAWTVTEAAPSYAGIPMGIGIAITYPE